MYSPQQQQQQFPDIGNSGGGDIMSVVSLMNLDSNSTSQPLRPDGQQPSVSMSSGSGRGSTGSVGIGGGQNAPGGGGGDGGGGSSGGDPWGPFGNNASFSPSSAEPAAAGTLNDLPTGGGRAQQDSHASEFLLAGDGSGGGVGGFPPTNRSLDSGPMFAGLAVDGRGSGGGSDMQAAVNASAAAAAMPGGNLGDLSRSSAVQPDAAPPPAQGGWRMYTSKENNDRAYWHNSETGETVSAG